MHVSSSGCSFNADWRGAGEAVGFLQAETMQVYALTEEHLEQRAGQLLLP